MFKDLVIIIVGTNYQYAPWEHPHVSFTMYVSNMDISISSLQRNFMNEDAIILENMIGLYSY